MTGDVWRLGLKAWGRLGTVGDQEGGSGSKREAAVATWLLWIVWGSDWLMADDR